MATRTFTLTPYTEQVETICTGGATYYQGTVTWHDQVQHTTACFPTQWEATDACLDWMNAQWREEAAWQETFGNPSATYWR